MGLSICAGQNNFEWGLISRGEEKLHQKQVIKLDKTHYSISYPQPETDFQASKSQCSFCKNTVTIAMVVMCFDLQVRLIEGEAT